MVAAFHATAKGRWVHNDDRIRADRNAGLFVVADASGPRYGGYYVPVAADAALDAYARALAAARGTLDDRLRDAVLAANAVLMAVGPEVNRRGALAHQAMALAGVALATNAAAIIQVGTLRGYRLRGERLDVIAHDQCLPEPHSLVAPLLGFGPIEPVVATMSLTPGDRIVLCTDGLWRCGDEILRAVAAASQHDLAALVAAAAEQSGDDASALVVEV